MTHTPAPQMITVLVTVTNADHAKYGRDAWLVNSIVDGEVDPYWTIETVSFAPLRAALRVAAALHLTRTHSDHRISRLGRVSAEEDADIQGELDDYSARSYRAELRLVAKG